MNTKTAILLVAGLVVVGVAIRYRSQPAEQASSPGQTEPASTRSMPRPRLPAPRVKPQATPVEAVAEILQLTNVFARLFKEDGELPKLSRDQIESYLAGGCSESEAKAAAAYTVLQPHMTELKRLGESLRDLGALYRQAGDEPSAHAVLETGLQLGRRLEESSGGSTTYRDMMGLAIQRSVLQGLEPGAPYGNTGQSVQNELDTLIQRRESLKSLCKQANPILQNMPDQELIRYFDRMKTFGETEALRWVMSRHGNR